MKYGYLRVSSKDQNLDRQIDILTPYELDQLYTEKASGKDVKGRPEFVKLLKVVQPGDEIYVTELSRFARSVKDLSTIAEYLTNKGVRLVSIKEGFDFTTATGKMLCNIIGAVAQFERETIHERQMQGIASAKARGKTFGVAKKYGLDTFKMDALFSSYYVGKITLQDALKEAEMKYGTFAYQYKKWRIANGVEGDLRKKKDEDIDSLL